MWSLNIQIMHGINEEMESFQRIMKDNNITSLDSKHTNKKSKRYSRKYRCTSIMSCDTRCVRHIIEWKTMYIANELCRFYFVLICSGKAADEAQCVGNKDTIEGRHSLAVFQSVIDFWEHCPAGCDERGRKGEE